MALFIYRKKRIFDNHTDLTGLKSMKTNSFKKTCKKYMKIHYINLWQKQKTSLSDGKLCTYFKFKQNFGFENYLNIIKDFGQRRIFTRFRISAHRLQIELGRYQGIIRQNRLCIHCSSGEVEDENHFLLTCTKYRGERNDLINAICLKCPNFTQLQNPEKFIWMMSNEDHEILCKICCLIAKHEHTN